MAHGGEERVGGSGVQRGLGLEWECAEPHCEGQLRAENALEKGSQDSSSKELQSQMEDSGYFLRAWGTTEETEAGG